MKSYTDLEQSKKLAEILPIESADMWWNYYSVTTDGTTPMIVHLNKPWVGSFNWNNEADNIPCWSLAALLNILKYPSLRQSIDGNWLISNWSGTFPWTGESSKTLGGYNNPIDACYEMIIKLHEQNIL